MGDLFERAKLRASVLGNPSYTNVCVTKPECLCLGKPYGGLKPAPGCNCITRKQGCRVCPQPMTKVYFETEWRRIDPVVCDTCAAVAIWRGPGGALRCGDCGKGRGRDDEQRLLLLATGIP
jgi:hypothetical protein